MIVFTVRSRRLPRRPLARRQGFLPRCLGEGAADHLRSVARRRHGARQRVRRDGRSHRSGADISRSRSAAIRRSNRTGSKAARCCRCCAASRRRHGGRSPSANTITAMHAGVGEAWAKAARRAPVHDRRQALETDPRHRLPADAVRSRQRSRRAARPRRRSGPCAANASGSRRRWRNGDCALSQRTTRSEQQIDNARGKAARRGILIGVWDEADIPAELWSGYLRDKR